LIALQAGAAAEALKSAQTELAFSRDVAQQYERQNDALQQQVRHTRHNTHCSSR
jgi:hypothetical protein